MKTTSPSHALQLPGLREDNPRDFLAALGLLRVVNLIWPEAFASLSWDIAQGTPVLCMHHPLPDAWGEQIWQQFLDWRDSPSKPFGHGKIEGISSEDFRMFLLGESSIEPNLVWFYTSLSSQLSHEKSGKRSEFIIESASKSVLTGILGILDQNRRNRPDVQADLMGTSERQKVKNTSRWHPGEFQAAAYMAADPEDYAFTDHLTLNVFALIGLSFYPVVDSARGRRTPGMIPERGQKVRFSWPIWEHSMSALCLPSILHDAFLHAEEIDAAVLQSRGISRVWRSRRFKANGDNQYFSKAEPMY